MNENNFSNFEPVMEPQPEPKKSNKTGIIIIILSLLLILAVGYIVYDNFIAKDSANNTNNNTNNNDKEDENQPSNLTPAQIEAVQDKVGTLFFWIKESKVEDVNNIDNDMKLCLAMKSIEKSNPSDPITAEQMSTAIQKIILNGTLINQTPGSSYGMECFGAIINEYDSTKRVYNTIATGHEGEIPVMVSILSKTDFDGKYYNFYYQNIYRGFPIPKDDKIIGKVYDDYTLKNEIATFDTYDDNGISAFQTYSTENKKLEEYVSLGSKHKLSFELKDNVLYWVKYEKID